jgi:hypothetical protein
MEEAMSGFRVGQFAIRKEQFGMSLHREDSGQDICICEADLEDLYRLVKRAKEEWFDEEVERI